ncbi:MAG: hypothetical protein ACI4V7_11845 [Succinivibrionaceae bacterium]
MSTIKNYDLKTKVKVTFEVSKEAARNAKNIYLLCSFNGWDPVKLTQKKDGSFSTVIDIDTKSVVGDVIYQYRFRYEWEDGSENYDNDWNAESYIPNQFGSENSVFTLSESSLKKDEPKVTKVENTAKTTKAKTTKACASKKTRK